jgi:hypothetical protein
MTLASSLEVLFAGPSQGIVAGILVAAAAAATAVLWTLIRLVVDRRAGRADDTDDTDRLRWDEATDPAYDDSYAWTRGDGTG